MTAELEQSEELDRVEARGIGCRLIDERLDQPAELAHRHAELAVDLGVVLGEALDRPAGALGSPSRSR